jgi:4-hydroxybenzoate polyprenyltransferase
LVEADCVQFIGIHSRAVTGQVKLLRKPVRIMNAEQPLMLSYAKILFDLSRGRQALLSVCQPALGAFMAIGASPGPYVLVVGVLAAICGYFAVFSLNDILDIKVDREAIALQSRHIESVEGDYDIDVAFLRHPLAHGKISPMTSIAWVAVLAAVSGSLAYILSPVSFLLFLACVAFEIIYCALRSVSWLKTVVSGVMVGLGGLAGWAAVAPLTVSSLGLFLFLAFWEIAGRNLPNDLADVDMDRLVGIKSVATVFGGRVSSIAIFVGSLVVMVIIGMLSISTVPKLIILALSIWLMVAPAIALMSEPSSTQAASYFNKASLLPGLAFIAVIPFMILRSL